MNEAIPSTALIQVARCQPPAKRVKTVMRQFHEHFIKDGDKYVGESLVTRGHLTGCQRSCIYADACGAFQLHFYV
jgi:hypothetical protein